MMAGIVDAVAVAREPQQPIEPAAARETIALRDLDAWCAVHPDTAALLTDKHFRGLLAVTTHGLLPPEADLLADDSFVAVSKSQRNVLSHGEERAALNRLREINGLPRLGSLGGRSQYSGGSAKKKKKDKDEDTWAACDECGKWRRLGPTATHDRRLAEAKHWTCRMNPDAEHSSCDVAEESWRAGSKRSAKKPWPQPQQKQNQTRLEPRVGALVKMPGSRFVTAGTTAWFCGKVARRRQQVWVVVYADGDQEEFDENDAVQRRDLRRHLVAEVDVSEEQKAMLERRAVETEGQEDEPADEQGNAELDWATQPIEDEADDEADEEEEEQEEGEEKPVARRKKSTRHKPRELPEGYVDSTDRRLSFAMSKSGQWVPDTELKLLPPQKKRRGPQGPVAQRAAAAAANPQNGGGGDDTDGTSVAPRPSKRSKSELAATEETTSPAKPWAPGECEKLLRLIERHDLANWPSGKEHWEMLAQKLCTGRTGRDLNNQFRHMEQDGGGNFNDLTERIQELPRPKTNRKGRQSWTDDELSKLDRLIEKYGSGDWDTKAEQLGSGRSGNSLYQKATQGWDREKVAAASASPKPARADSVSGKSYHPWTNNVLKRLKRLIKKDGWGDWDTKAEQLDSGHTGASLKCKVKKDWDKEQACWKPEAVAAAAAPLKPTKSAPLQPLRKETELCLSPVSSARFPPLAEQLRVGKCYLLEEDVTGGQEERPIPVYGPRRHPTPAEGPRLFRYTATSEWLTPQPPRWTFLPTRRHGTCPCVGWAPSTFLTAELVMDGAERPPRLHAMKEQLAAALTMGEDDECEICVHISTFSGRIDGKSDAAPKQRGSQSRQPSLPSHRLASSASYSSYTSRIPGASLVGGYINQQFDCGSGRLRWYRGQIAEFDLAGDSYLMRYEDGDQRSLTEAEVLTHLEEPDEAAESRWVCVPAGLAAKNHHSLRQIAGATGCEYNDLREINARHFPYLANKRSAADDKFQVGTYIQLPSSELKASRKASAATAASVLKYSYVRSIHIECAMPFEDAKRALFNLPGYTVINCEDKSKMFKLEGEAPLKTPILSEKTHTAVGARTTKKKTEIADDDDDEDEDEGWDIERIIKKGRTADGTVVYRVRWLGYSAFADTWQTANDLKGARESIDLFESKLSKKAVVAVVPEGEYVQTLLERGPLVRQEEADLLVAGTKLWLKWQKDADEWHQGEISRASKTPGWFDMKFDLVLSDGGKTACFHLSQFMAERKVCWTSSGPPPGQTDSPTNEKSASVVAAAAAAAAVEQKTATKQQHQIGGGGGGREQQPPPQKQLLPKQQREHEGYYDEHGRLRFWMQLPVRECSSWCGCSRNCPNRKLQKGISVSGMTIQWMGKESTLASPIAN